MTPHCAIFDRTWGSRCMVMAGGAVATACRVIAKRAARIGGRLLQTDPAQILIHEGKAVGPHGSVSLAEIARAWYLRPQDLPRTWIPEVSKPPSGTNRRATAEPSAMPRMPR